ncbi:MAG TPA: hypothetical protein DCY80_15835 [Solibacterales bacterium]|nr:hypothetical protein [Bryobacterales bacterium]
MPSITNSSFDCSLPSASRWNLMALYWATFRAALHGTYSHGALGFAKGAAYSALLAFFPVLTTVTTLLVQANAPAVSQRIETWLFQVAPPGVDALINNFLARGARPAAIPIVATLLAAWAASGVTTSLLEAYQAAYRRPHSRGIVRQRLLAIVLVIGSLIPVLLASALLLFGDRVETWIFTQLGFLDAGEVLAGGVNLIAHAIRIAVAFAAIVAVTAVMYRFGPQAPRRRHVWPGAIFASILWLSLTAGFAWYVRNIANYNVFYGSIGAVMALIVWMYLLSLSAMFGCEFNARLDERAPRR